jgi:hypothetical protein
MRAPLVFLPTAMNSPGSTLSVPVGPQPLAALAERLRDGPLQHLLELQAELTELTQRVTACPASSIDDVEHLVRLSVVTMQHFNAFTRELAAVLHELTDAHREPD